MYEEEIRLAWDLFCTDKKIQSENVNISQLRYFLKMIGINLDDEAMMYLNSEYIKHGNFEKTDIISRRIDNFNLDIIQIGNTGLT